MKLIDAILPEAGGHAKDGHAQGGHAQGMPLLALVGSGGKTSAWVRLSRELPAPVIVTATAHLALEQTGLADVWHSITDPGQIQRAFINLSGVTLFTGKPGVDGRTAGLDEAALAVLYRLAEDQCLPVLVEADGSRRLPLKAPAEHEPVIPAWVDQVVVVAGLSGLGRALSHETVHHPEIFARLSGLAPGEIVTVETLARVLVHPRGGLKSIPVGAARIALINQADNPALLAQAQTLARLLLPVFPRVIIASLENGAAEEAVKSVYSPVAGVVLAAGGSTRFGGPKQLIDWFGQPMVRHVARTALAAELDPVVVVVGAHQDGVRRALEGLPVIVVDNPDWAAGQSSSIRAGVEALPGETGAAIFLLSDQPQAPERLLSTLVETHRQSLSPVVAPRAGGRRTNPVLFDRQTFADLLGLTGDVGGRALFSKYRITWVEWLDDRLAMDIDTPEDYRRLFESMNE